MATQVGEIVLHLYLCKRDIEREREREGWQGRGEKNRKRRREGERTANCTSLHTCTHAYQQAGVQGRSVVCKSPPSLQQSCSHYPCHTTASGERDSTNQRVVFCPAEQINIKHSPPSSSFFSPPPTYPFLFSFLLLRPFFPPLSFLLPSPQVV